MSRRNFKPGLSIVIPESKSVIELENKSNCFDNNKHVSVTRRYKRNTHTYKNKNKKNKLDNLTSNKTLIYKELPKIYEKYIDNYINYYDYNINLHKHLLKILNKKNCGTTKILYSMNFKNGYKNMKDNINYKVINNVESEFNLNLIANVLAFLLEMNYKGGLNTDLGNLENVIFKKGNPEDFYIIDYDYFQISDDESYIFPYDALMFIETILKYNNNGYVKDTFNRTLFAVSEGVNNVVRLDYKKVLYSNSYKDFINGSFNYNFSNIEFFKDNKNYYKSERALIAKLCSKYNHMLYCKVIDSAKRNGYEFYLL